MLDAADIAILETSDGQEHEAYRPNLNPVETGLLDELIRLRNEREDAAVLAEKVDELEEELDEAKSALELANEEIQSLKTELTAAKDCELEADRQRNRAESALEDLKSSMREVCA